jgi:hypothetical protein
MSRDNLQNVSTGSKYLIYALVDPRSGEWRYIGKSCSGLRRPHDHVRECFLRSKTHKNNWVKSLLAIGLRPVVEVVEEIVDPEKLSDAEMEWISAARAVGCSLTNETDGGEGLLGRKHSKATRLKMSSSRHGLCAAQRAEVVRLYDSGLSTRAIAEVVKTGCKVVWRVLKVEGTELRPQLSGFIKHAQSRRVMRLA